MVPRVLVPVNNPSATDAVLLGNGARSELLSQARALAIPLDFENICSYNKVKEEGWGRWRSYDC